MPLNSEQHMALVDRYSARNYLPLPVILAKGEGVWVWDNEGKKYLDMLSSYSALNQGHRHPRIVQAMKDQLDRLALTSRAFHHDQFGPFCEYLCNVAGQDQVLLMNTGAEGVETAIKCCRKWGYEIKGVPADKAEIVVCENNFHGRTSTIVGFSSEEAYRKGFGPFSPGFRLIPYDDLDALEKAMSPNTVGFMVEPIQGEAGIIVPQEGFLRKAKEICGKHNALLITDEIQTGLGRAGKLFCYEYDGIKPDILVVGKALGGGCFPVSGILTSKDIMKVFTPGIHGSTFGGNPMACAAGKAALQVIVEEELPRKSFENGKYLKDRLQELKSPLVQEIRGKGLFVGVHLKDSSGPARPFCERLMKLGILAKETHGQVIRFAPPLVITRTEIDWAMERIAGVLKA
jgi:ornithine--oxo-acid transaminase